MNKYDLSKLPPLSIPLYPLRIEQREDGELKVYDELRKKSVALTPEEFVRQNYVKWLMQSMHYPASLLQNEVNLTVNGTRKRCDTIAFDREGKPLVIVEYKAPGVEITQEVFDQIYRYNLSFKAKYLIVTNGIRQYCCKVDYDRNTYFFIRNIPTFHEANGLPHEN